MSLLDANWCPQAAVMLNNGKEITDEKKAELKATFLEGLIRFLDIYAQTEIGEGIQIDIMKVALHINSARFENDDLYDMESIDDVYKLCEELTISGLPIWRFLRLSEYQNKVLESGYSEILVSAKRKAAKERPCYGCIWYREVDTFLGMLRRCERPRIGVEWNRRESPDPDEILKCDWLTTLDSIPKAIEKLSDSANLSRKRIFIESIEPARERFKKELLKDPFRIPKSLSEKEIISLNKQYDPLKDFGRALNNEKTYTECQVELRKAMYIEGMIRFFEMYARCEIGSRYVADVKNISLYVWRLEDSDVKYIKSFDDVYADLEEKLINGFNVDRFIKFDEEL